MVQVLLTERREDLKDDDYHGGPSISTTDESVEAMIKLIMENRVIRVVDKSVPKLISFE